MSDLSTKEDETKIESKSETKTESQTDLEHIFFQFKIKIREFIGKEQEVKPDNAEVKKEEENKPEVSKTTAENNDNKPDEVLKKVLKS